LVHEKKKNRSGNKQSFGGGLSKKNSGARRGVGKNGAENTTWATRNQAEGGGFHLEKGPKSTAGREKN